METISIPKDEPDSPVSDGQTCYPLDTGNKPFKVADDLGAALEEIAALTDQEASVRAEQVRIRASIFCILEIHFSLARNRESTACYF